jgi:hypothetical protein
VKTNLHETSADGCVVIDDDEAVIVDLHVDDPTVVSVLRETDDPAETARRLLSLGATRSG